MNKITLITDGSCVPQGDVNPGGWAAILRFGEHEKVLTGNAIGATSQRMEVTALIEGVKAVKYACDITVKTDSQYVIGVASQGWKINANRELWSEYFGIVRSKGHKMTFVWVKGHAGNPDNERADKLAQQARNMISRRKPSEIPCNHNGRGLYDSVNVGWHKIDECRIEGDGFIVEFYGFAKRHIDPNCDAFNGWESVWTEWKAEYKDNIGSICLHTSKEKHIDKLFEIMSSVKPVVKDHCPDGDSEDWGTTSSFARVGFQAIVDHIGQ